MIDKQTIAAYLGHDPALVRRFIQLFVQQAPDLMAHIGAQMRAGEWGAAAANLHALKGQLRYFGLQADVECLAAIEAAAEAGGGEPVAAAWSAFGPRFATIYTAIMALEG